MFFSSGVFVGSAVQAKFLSATQITDDKDLNELFEPFFQAWSIVHDQFLNQPVDDVKMMQGAIRGLMDSLDDPYTAYMDPEEYRTQNTPLQGEYTGIGAWVDTTGEYLVILSPMPDSPSEKVGIEPGDKVVEVDGEDVTGFDPVIVLEKILGPAGTSVNITIEREGEPEFLHFEVERAVIPIPSVESELLEEELGYIRLYTFGAISAEEFQQALSELINQGAAGIILDLRNNTGGFVDTAIEIISEFIPEGIVMIEEWADGTTDEYKATGDPMQPEIPLVVLVNNGSASASEIVAGALQDYDRAELVGTQTFGKGLIQNWIPLIGENGAVRVTTARWLTPDGRQIQDNGLTPDFIAEITESDIENEFDTQLERAKEVLSQMIAK